MSTLLLGQSNTKGIVRRTHYWLLLSLFSTTIPKSFSAALLIQPVQSSACTTAGVQSLQFYLQDLVFVLTEFHKAPVVPFLQLVYIPLNRSPGPEYINHTTWDQSQTWWRYKMYCRASYVYCISICIYVSVPIQNQEQHGLRHHGQLSQLITMTEKDGLTPCHLNHCFCPFTAPSCIVLLPALHLFWHVFDPELTSYNVK